MIGVVARPDQQESVEEFFELFKTPWEPARPGRKYRVVLSTGGSLREVDAGTYLVYGSGNEVDHGAASPVERLQGITDADWQGTQVPLYGPVALFGLGDALITHGGRRVAYHVQHGDRATWRVGYDLFDEVRHLLTSGQPSERAHIPTLDIHIAVLRELLNRSHVSFVEVPPRPAGYEFICCLTHDLDFFGIRRHAFDATLGGFIARATVGTVTDVVRRRRSFAEARRNFRALLSLPFVLTGLQRDFWQPIDDYRQADRGHPSTFFVVPFKNRPGVGPDGSVRPRRAVKYQAGDVADEVAVATTDGDEVAVHGIDAWRDEEAGRNELAQVARVGAGPSPGVRMHWLYFDAGSPHRLEAAGFQYDSTCGYNDAVGYRAGTGQAFRMRGTERLMELPIAIMDSALFFPGRMNLTREQALARCRKLIAHARATGGAVVVNWHDRSLAPERLWGGAYQELLDEVESRPAWFATAIDAVEWFQWRRSVSFRCENDGVVTMCAPPLPAGKPAARVSVHRAASAESEEHVLDGGGILRVTL